MGLNMVTVSSSSFNPLPKSLSIRALNALARNGINSVEQVVKAYPEGLLKMQGLGLESLRDIEMALFPWQRYTPPPKLRGRLPKKSVPSIVYSHELLGQKEDATTSYVQTDSQIEQSPMCSHGPWGLYFLGNR